MPASSTTNQALSRLNYQSLNKKVKERTFKKGDLVLAVRRPMVMTHKTKEKFHPKSNGAYRLIIPDSNTLMMPINGRFLKKYCL